MMHPHVVALLGALAAASAPSASIAATDIRSVNGVEIITFQRDAVRPTTAHATVRHRARPTVSTAAIVTRARALVVAAELHGASLLVRNAMHFVGTPYVWGGSAPGGFDCSGFIYYLYGQMGIRIPRTADYQFAAGRPVVGDPLPGDLVFFQTYDYGASHVGLYLGEGRFVNSIGDNVHVASFASPYFRSRYLGARRFLST